MKNKRFFSILLAVLIVVVPTLVMAQFGPAGSTPGTVPGTTSSQGVVTGGFVFGIITFLETLIKRLFPLGIAIAGLAFIYELIMFIWTKGNGDSGDKSEKFKKGIIYSLLALFLMLTFWGIIKVVASSFGLQVGDDITRKQIPTVEL